MEKIEIVYWLWVSEVFTFVHVRAKNIKSFPTTYGSRFRLFVLLLLLPLLRGLGYASNMCWRWSERRSQFIRIILCIPNTCRAVLLLLCIAGRSRVVASWKVHAARSTLRWKLSDRNFGVCCRTHTTHIARRYFTFIVPSNLRFYWIHFVGYRQQILVWLLHITSMYLLHTSNDPMKQRCQITMSNAVPKFVSIVRRPSSG